GAALWGGFGGYPPANLGRALAAAVERGGKHVVPLGPQPLGNEFPDPPALIGAVNEYEVGHDFLPIAGDSAGWHCNAAQSPPVTSMVRPVTKSACEEARKQMTLAWSAASPMRRSGVLWISAARSSGGRCSQRGRMRSVNVVAGAMALTLMPKGPSSLASFVVSAMMPPFAAE